ncbi:MAG: hypothetical protein ACE5OR_08570 [bacterium]
MPRGLIRMNPSLSSASLIFGVIRDVPTILKLTFGEICVKEKLQAAEREWRDRIGVSFSGDREEDQIYFSALFLSLAQPAIGLNFLSGEAGKFSY